MLNKFTVCCLAAVVGGLHMILTSRNDGNEKVLGFLDFPGSQLVQPAVGIVLVGCGVMCLSDMRA